MIYQSTILDKKKNEYTIQIRPEGASWSDTPTELVAAKDGAIITIDGDSDIFRPIRSGGATISLRSGAQHYDIYSGKRDGSAVRILKGGNIYWCGYTSPNLYNQDYARGRSTLQVECNDCLAVLKEKKFSPVTATGLTTIKAYLEKAVELASGTAFSLTAVIEEPWADVTLDKLAVQERNWYDESGEPTNWEEVLSQLLTWCNMTAMQVGNSIYFISLRKIVSGSYRTVGYLDTISRAATPQVSLTQVCQKIKATVSLYSQDALLPGFFDDKLISYVSNDSEAYSKANEDKHYSAYYTFLTHKNITLYAYDKATLAASTPITTTQDFKNKIGAALVKMRSNTINTPSTSEGTLVNSLNAEDAIIIARHCTNDAATALKNMYYSNSTPMLKMVQELPIVFGNNDYGIVISGSVRFNNKITVIPFENENGTAASQTTVYLTCSLKIGDKYYRYNLNGNADSVWSSDEFLFNLPISPNEDKLTFNDFQYINKDLRIRNYIGWSQGIDKQGYFIPIKAVNNIHGPVEFKLYGLRAPVAPNGEAGGLCYAWLKNFDISIVKNGWSFSEDAGLDDIEYIAEIDSGNAEESVDIDMSVATDVGRDFSLASVILLNATGGIAGYVGEVTRNSVTQIAEKHLLTDYYTQYHSPRKIIDATFLTEMSPIAAYFSNVELCKFIVNSISYNVGECECETQLIEYSL